MRISPVNFTVSCTVKTESGQSLLISKELVINEKMKISRQISEYVNSIDYGDVPDTSIKNINRLILDTLGCGIGAYGEPTITKARNAIKGMKGGRSTVLGTAIKTEPEIAAFVNGAMTRYFDFNDTYDSKEFSHPSDNIMPMLAVAESEGRNGRDAILACLLAYEIQARLADSANLWKRGWDHVIYGLVSVSASASRLMRLDDDKTEQAINIALNSHLVMRQVRAGMLSEWKAFAFSDVARNAIFSARLAREGITGPDPVFEGEMGFFNQVSGRFTFNAKRFGGLKGRFRIDKNLMKYYPAETRAQAAIFAALDLRRKIHSIDEIASVEIGAGEATVKVIGSGAEKWKPETKETADHSIPYIVAAALIDGGVGIETFERKRFEDRTTVEFMKRIKVNEIKKYTSLFNKGGTVNAASLRIVMKNGGVLYKEVLYSKGHWKNPMSNKEIEEKFRKLALRKLSEPKTNKAISMVWNLDKLKDIGLLFKEFC